MALPCCHSSSPSAMATLPPHLLLLSSHRLPDAAFQPASHLISVPIRVLSLLECPLTIS